ncbi:hypothetical protein [Sphingomonas glaciei]|uniref:Uncharacterized protein n=1 Tax=Sphingomonas glaciei TaxID=2938948 RepID=A0ABY5MZJ9_9SPHN|nr:hypothetical protein [Sphingomonas glaciei]UUR08899.1 hypothetical protein M1K48_04520 [Sphingomonas glaciei]
MRRLLLLLASTMRVFFSSPAAADVLTAENKVSLCTADYQGRVAVDRDELAYAIVGIASGINRYLDGANPAGLRNGSIERRSKSGLSSEPLYAVRNAGTKLPPQPIAPSGPP